MLLVNIQGGLVLVQRALFSNLNANAKNIWGKGADFQQIRFPCYVLFIFVRDTANKYKYTQMKIQEG